MIRLEAVTLAVLAAGALAVAAGEQVISADAPFGWLGSVLLAGVSAFALHRAGSVRAWKETAEAREQRIEDLEERLAAATAELAIPERIEGIVRLMAETAATQEKAATGRLREALERVDQRWAEHDRAASLRAQQIITAIAQLGDQR